MILDVGCGEGSLLNQVINKLNDKSSINFDSVGIDISKEGIKIASKEYPDNIWCVRDLAKNPFMNKRFDVLLNILSPSNYSELNRIKSDTGILIKVVPGSSSRLSALESSSSRAIFWLLSGIFGAVW